MNHPPEEQRFIDMERHAVPVILAAGATFLASLLVRVPEWQFFAGHLVAAFLLLGALRSSLRQRTHLSFWLAGAAVLLVVAVGGVTGRSSLRVVFPQSMSLWVLTLFLEVWLLKRFHRNNAKGQR
jgi:hypothetical protein